MKKVYIIILFLLPVTLTYAQKYAVIDSEYIFGKMPKYKSAQEQIEKIAAQYQKEVDDAYAAVDKLFKTYQNEKPLLTEEMRKRREDEIINKEKEVKELQKKYFSPNGDLSKKREDLLKPIQDQVFNAIREYANEGGYSVIFDSANNSTLVFVSAKFDKSDDILRKIGL